jgi:hypothetical protein
MTFRIGARWPIWLTLKDLELPPSGRHLGAGLKSLLFNSGTSLPAACWLLATVEENLMTELKGLTAVAVLSTIVVAPAMAQQAYHRGHDGYRDRGPVDAAGGIAGAAIGTAAAIATAPFRASYAYDNGYGYDNEYARRNGFVCQPGTWFRGEDGRRHLCQ